MDYHKKNEDKILKKRMKNITMVVEKKRQKNITKIIKKKLKKTRKRKI